MKPLVTVMATALSLFAQPPSNGLPLTYERLLRAAGEPHNWLTYGGDYRSHHYSSLKQISTGNVRGLRVKWIYQMHKTKVETTPVVIDGIMYVTRPPSDVIALDAETGRALWTIEYRVAARPYVCCGEVNRGVAVLGNNVHVTTLDAKLIALDARPGRVLWKKDIADPAMNYSATTAPLAIKDKLIVGIAGAEGAIGGFLDAYDDGRARMALWTMPGKREPGSETWGGESHKYGRASTWTTGPETRTPETRTLQRAEQDDRISQTPWHVRNLQGLPGWEAKCHA